MYIRDELGSANSPRSSLSTRHDIHINMDSMINVKSILYVEFLTPYLVVIPLTRSSTGNNATPETTSNTTAPAVKTDSTGDISVEAAEKDVDTTVEKETAPAVEHETVKHQHELREQESVDRERHQHHYHTTVQPLKDREVEPEKHDHETASTQYRALDKGNHAAEEKAGLDADGSSFKNTSKDVELQEQHTTEKPSLREEVHHHYHETVQPVIEKGKSCAHLALVDHPLMHTLQKRSRSP